MKLPQISKRDEYVVDNDLLSSRGHYFTDYRLNNSKNYVFMVNLLN